RGPAVAPAISANVRLAKMLAQNMVPSSPAAPAEASSPSGCASRWYAIGATPNGTAHSTPSTEVRSEIAATSPRSPSSGPAGSVPPRSTHTTAMPALPVAAAALIMASTWGGPDRTVCDNGVDDDAIPVPVGGRCADPRRRGQGCVRQPARGREADPGPDGAGRPGLVDQGVHRAGERADRDAAAAVAGHAAGGRAAAGDGPDAAERAGGPRARRGPQPPDPA